MNKVNESGNEMTIQASCQCQRVTFTSTREPVIQLVCHCVDCQQALNSAYAAIAFFRANDTEIYGEFARKIFTAESGNRTFREYCPNCNTVMFDKSDGFPTLIGVIGSQLLLPFEIKPSCHVWVKDKQDQISLPNDLPCYDKGIPRS